ncbi:hypothetical protein Scel_29210 [Streptomyces cellostaticus]|nr:hypothetical protein Scel_29210 [Streptomyces cellostaticus]
MAVRKGSGASQGPDPPASLVPGVRVERAVAVDGLWARGVDSMAVWVEVGELRPLGELTSSGAVVFGGHDYHGRLVDHPEYGCTVSALWSTESLCGNSN